MTRRLRRLIRPLHAVAEPRAPADTRLTERVARLEQTVEDLQDSSYRQAQRTDAELAELRRRLNPAEVAKSLSDDARRRGL